MDKADPPAETCERWLVAGCVQGVGFRWFVLRSARQRGLRGDVRNLRDGRVEVRVAGTPSLVDDLLDDVRQGPRGARVDEIERTLEGAELPSGEFSIRP